VFRRENRVLAVGALASTTCNSYMHIADLLFLSEVPHPLLVAGPPGVHPLFRGMGPVCRARSSSRREPNPLHLDLGSWRLMKAGALFTFLNTLQSHPTVILYALLYAKSTIPNAQHERPRGHFVIFTWRRPTLGQQGVTTFHFHPLPSRVTESRSHGPSLISPPFFVREV
jgi:hypothetical protein